MASLNIIQIQEAGPWRGGGAGAGGCAGGRCGDSAGRWAEPQPAGMTEAMMVRGRRLLGQLLKRSFVVYAILTDGVLCAGGGGLVGGLVDVAQGEAAGEPAVG